MIKAEMDGYNKAVILGALLHAMKSLEADEYQVSIFESMGSMRFCVIFKFMNGVLAHY